MRAKGCRRRLRRAGRLLLVVAALYAGAGYLTSRIDPAPTRIIVPLAAAAPPPASGVEVRVVDPAEPFPAGGGGGAVEVRGVLSVHSGRSHDAEGTLDEIAAAAERTDLDFVVLGDHPGAWLGEPGALDPERKGGVLMIPGQEMVIMEHGRVLAVGLEADTIVERWEGTVAELAARITAVDGYVAIVHARSPRERERWRAGPAEINAPGVHGWESLDVSEIARVRLVDRWAGYHVTSFLAGLLTGRAHGPVLRLYREGTTVPGLLAYDSARAREPLTLTAGLNHHVKARLGGRLIPPYTPFFRTLVNHVVLPDALPEDPREARRALLAGLRAGDVFVSLGDAARAEGFRFRAVDDRTLVVRLPPTAPGRYFVRLVHDGRELGWVPAEGGAVLSLAVPDPGVYRVEVARAGIPLGPWRHGLRPWILSNAVELHPAAAEPPSPLTEN